MAFDFLSAKSNQDPNQKEKVFHGLLGSFLFALGGGAVWVLLSQIGIIAGIAGLATIILAINGYKKFGKKLTKRGIVIAIIVSIIVVIIAWMISMNIDVYKYYSDAYEKGHIQVKPGFFQAGILGWIELTENAPLRNQYISELAIGLLACGFVSFIYIKSLLRKIKEEQKQQADSGVVSCQEGAEEVVEEIDPAAFELDSQTDAPEEAVEDAGNAPEEAAEDAGETPEETKEDE